MPTTLKLRRGTTAGNNSFTGAEGEVTYDTQRKTLRTHDGSTAGGAELAKSGAIGSSLLTMTTARLLGRTTASTGAVEEITVGTGLSLSSGSLTGVSYGNQSFRRLVAAPLSSTTFQVTAQECVTRDPSTGATRRLGSIDITSSNLASAQGGSTANGRDQSGTFSAGVIFCFVISGSGQSNALLFSTSETAPTLPTNYTEWAVVGPLRWSGTVFDANYRYRGSVCTIDTGVTVLSGGTATTETSVSMSGYVPTTTEEYRLSASGTATADGSANYNIQLALRSITAVDQVSWQSPYKAASASAGGMPTWMGRECWLANTVNSNSFYYIHTVTTGSAPSTNIILRGFRYSNGAN